MSEGLKIVVNACAFLLGMLIAAAVLIGLGV